MGTLIWAHRGASAYAPENTLPSFEEAVRRGADGVELDIQLTCDGQVVVVHDERLERVSNGTGWVRDYTLAQLKALRFNRTHPEYREAVISTLAEVYDLLRPTNLTVNVEFKTGVVWYKGIIEKTLELTRAAGMEERVIYSSFNHYTLRKLKEQKPEAQTGLLYSDDWIDVARYARDTVRVNALHPALYHLQDPSYIRTAHAYGLETHVWTVNDPEQIRRCRDLGVEAIITNKPDLCRQVLEESS